MRNFKIIINSLILTILIAIGGYISFNWNSIKLVLKGNVYSKSQIENSYKQGYIDAGTNESNYQIQLNYYCNLLEEKQQTILKLTKTVNSLKNSNEIYENKNSQYVQEINLLNEQIASLQEQVSKLQAKVEEFKEGVKNEQIDEMTAFLTSKIQETNNNGTIAISSIENVTIDKLSDTDYSIQLFLDGIIGKAPKQSCFLTTIKTSGEEVENLIQQDKEAHEYSILLNSTIQSSSSIFEKTKSISKFEVENTDSVIERLFTERLQQADVEEKSQINKYIINPEEFKLIVYNAICTNSSTKEYTQTAFIKYNDNLWTFKIVTLFDMTPTATDVKEYFKQMLNNTYQAEYTINSSYTRNINFLNSFLKPDTIEYKVKFVINDNVYSTQTVIKNGYAELPSSSMPMFMNCEDKWSINGISVNINSYQIVTNTIFNLKLAEGYHILTLFSADKEFTNIKTYQGWGLSEDKKSASKIFQDGIEISITDIASQLLFNNAEITGWKDGINELSNTITTPSENACYKVIYTNKYTITAVIVEGVETGLIAIGENSAWVKSGENYIKSVVEGKSIGKLLGSCKWFYLDDNQNQVLITQDTLMPNHDIIIYSAN